MFFTVSPQLACDMQRLCLQTGRSASVALREPRENVMICGNVVQETLPSYQVCVLQAGKRLYCENTDRYPDTVTRVSYCGMVYCVGVAQHHTLYTRLNGKPVWSGNSWDGGSIAQDPEFWAKVYAVMRPGAHLVAFGGTRTEHRMTCAIEDAGFEIRDKLAWLYGSGMPKSHDAARGIDIALSAKGYEIATGKPVKRMIPGADQNGTGSWIKDNGRTYTPNDYIPATPEAQQWDGWGTALKPALEPIVLARKPLDGTVARNLLQHGVGALNIDTCRIESGGTHGSASSAGRGAGRESANVNGNAFGKGLGGVVAPPHPLGRWPANVLHDGSPEVEEAFGQFGEKTSGVPGTRRRPRQTGSMLGTLGMLDRPEVGYADTGSASRFFYCAKASSRDRAGSQHPTVKPQALMRWLVRLVTPPGGLILDPFAGSGSTGEAAWREGFRSVLIEREAEYVADIRARMARLTDRAA